MSRSVDFYYDFSSPNAYFAALLLPGVAERTGAQINYKPVLLGGIFKTLGTPPAPGMSTPQKATAARDDMNRWSKKYEIPFKFPSTFPMNTVKALRLALAISEVAAADHAKWCEAAFKAYWVDDQNISDEAVLTELLKNNGFDVEALLKRITEPELKDKLKAETQAAVERQVFGAPTMFVGEELFFGKDRLDFVEDALKAG